MALPWVVALLLLCMAMAQGDDSLEVVDDVCDADSGNDCSLSLRQLRALRTTSGVVELPVLMAAKARPHQVPGVPLPPIRGAPAAAVPAGMAEPVVPAAEEAEIAEAPALPAAEEAEIVEAPAVPAVEEAEAEAEEETEAEPDAEPEALVVQTLGAVGIEKSHLKQLQGFISGCWDKPNLEKKALCIKDFAKTEWKTDMNVVIGKVYGYAFSYAHGYAKFQYDGFNVDVWG